tara:strand:- start:4796 stop:5254 length:459 start_codon:yes stop_codon:yes gene_type:complete
MFITLLFGIGSYAQESIKIDEVVNSIVMGPQAGNRDLAFGVQNILEEVVQEKGYELNPNSNKILKVELLYFDVKSTNMQLAVYGNTVEVTEIIAGAKITLDGKELKTVIVRGQAKSISTATLIIDEGGKFSQANVSSALKKLCEQLIEKLKL